MFPEQETNVFDCNTVLFLRKQNKKPWKQQSKTKYEPAIYMCKETTENGVLLKEHCCVPLLHECILKVDYSKPSDCKKKLKTQI